MSRDEAYKIAKEKIEEALRSGTTELNLSGGFSESNFKKLTELPELLGQLTQLQSLDLSNTQLTTLPAWLGELTQLQSLDLSNTQLTTLPAWLGELTQLQSLGLSNNQLTTLPEWLGQLTQLQSLSLSNNQLTTLPEWLSQLTQLQSLSVSNTQLTTLPAWLGELTQLQSLGLSNNQLTTLPEWLGQLTQLQSLDVSNNQLTTLPEWLGQLTQLQSLSVSNNQLTTLPEWLGQLTQLQSLSVSNNQLTTLPEWLGHLKSLRFLRAWTCGLVSLPESLGNLVSLEDLSVVGNRLTKLPISIGKLKALQNLNVQDNQLESLPDSLGNLQNLLSLVLGWAAMTNPEHPGNPIKQLPACIGRLTNLEKLYLNDCELTDLPTSLVHLSRLKTLYLAQNPLNPELAAAYKEGLDAVKRYLRELEKGGKDRYEAKLLILGDGNEGKTCVSRALRDLPFRDQKTTRGVDIVQWKFPHPDNTANQEKEITLNIWDFEGQEISHQTHQFFLTPQALYVLVFKCRDLFLIDRAEYWLDTIRARAPQAKVVIVISQCEERSPHIPLDRIEAQYRDLLAKDWFFAVGCKNGKSIPELQSFLRRSAAELDFMGTPWPKSYERAESTIKARAKKSTSHITRSNLNGILRKAGVNEDNFDGAAGSLARIGALTQFLDCVDLRDFVVLRPQWLTKAISKVMEDDQLSDDKGEIALRRMESIWNKARYSGMFPTFHNCMKEFELCYDLEDQDDSCLVPLRFGYVAPTIPWTDGPDLKARRVQYKLDIRPPMGLMSRFIVKTHHMIVKTPEHPKGVYWHNGVFLRTNSPFPSEALVEFVPEDRTFKVEVRAAYPQNMCEQIHAYIQAVFSFFRGLSAERSYGCIKVNAVTHGETRCIGLHTEKRIYTAISRERMTLDCEFEEHEVDPRLLVWGFGSFGDFLGEKIAASVRQEMDRPPKWAAPFLRGIGTLLDWVNSNRERLDELLRGQAQLSAEFKQETELRFHEYLGRLSQLLDNREQTAAPS